MLGSVMGVRLATLSAPTGVEDPRRDRTRRRGRARVARSSSTGTPRPATAPSDAAPRAAALEEGGPAGTNVAPPAPPVAPAPAPPIATRDPVVASPSRGDEPPPPARVAPLDDVGTASRAPKPPPPPEQVGETGSRLERAREARDRFASLPPLRRRRAEIETARPDDLTSPS
ncbi:MAG: hypothetical protein KatS3mg010_1993 [Acidimicrobiia bacterium]|nr:MAG: hypothetical protein KatS3mg010_1993 [Acidimicrobiia bacterium]